MVLNVGTRLGHRKEHEEAPVIRFHDGWHLRLNQGMCRDLIAAWGNNADDWVGQWIRVYRRPMPQRDPEDLRPPL